MSSVFSPDLFTTSRGPHAYVYGLESILRHYRIGRTDVRWPVYSSSFFRSCVMCSLRESERSKLCLSTGKFAALCTLYNERGERGYFPTKFMVKVCWRELTRDARKV